MRQVHRVGAQVWIGLSALGALTACETQDRLTAPASIRSAAALQASAAADRPFYYYEGTPVYLEADPTTIIVSTRDASPAQAARSALGAFAGVRVSDDVATLAVPGHRVLKVVGATRANVDSLAVSLRKDSRFDFAAPAFSAVVGGQQVWLVNQLDVQFKTGVTSAQIAQAITTAGARIIRTPKPDSGFLAYRLAYAPGRDPLKVSQDLDRNPIVEWADPDRISAQAPTYVPSDPFYGQQFHLRNTQYVNGVSVDINVEPAWDLTLGSHSIRVTVIDDGVDILHTNSGGGYAGDLIGPFSGAQGYDLMAAVATGDTQWYPFGSDTHGTSVAGIIAATQDNGVGGSGIAPNVTLNAIRIFRRVYPPENSAGTQRATEAQIGDAINYAWQGMQSDVINNSWGGGMPSNAITGAINNALSMGRAGKGTVVVFSAGNPSARQSGVIGSVAYPANLSSTRNVISVGAIDRYGNAADYTPNGVIDVVAPSGQFTGYCMGEIVTNDRYGTPGCNDGPGGAADFTSSFSGTSAAAPQVSGVAALMLSRSPALTAAQVKAKLRSSANPWGATTTFGAGKLNAFSALQ